MDFTWRCNALKCRAQLQHHAVVTTCSHIFCEPCADALGLANPKNGVRTCPACHTRLQNPDDAVVTNLDPAEDYKTSILSGLSPTIIMECAGRGLNFYTYQITQEVMYQEYLAKKLTDKYNKQSSELDKLVHDANTEIQNLHDQLSAMSAERSDLEKKNHELVERLHEKARAQHQTQKLYNQLKQRQMAVGVELAVDRDAEHLLAGDVHSGSDRARRSDERLRNIDLNERLHGHTDDSGRGKRIAHGWENQLRDGRTGLGTGATHQNFPINATPAKNRQRLLPAAVFGNQVMNGRAGSVVDSQHQVPPFRQPLAELNPNSHGYGMSAGVKVGRQQGGPPPRLAGSRASIPGVWGRG